MAILNPLPIILMLLCMLALPVSHLIRQNDLSNKYDPVNDYKMPTNSTQDPCEWWLVKSQKRAHLTLFYFSTAILSLFFMR